MVLPRGWVEARVPRSGVGAADQSESNGEGDDVSAHGACSWGLATERSRSLWWWWWCGGGRGGGRGRGGSSVYSIGGGHGLGLGLSGVWCWREVSGSQKWGR